MSYDKSHKPSMCDKCGKDVGEKNLQPVKFFYLDKNDLLHPDVSAELGYPKGTGYHSYKICSVCKKRGV